jgi:hypothetical protein
MQSSVKQLDLQSFHIIDDHIGAIVEYIKETRDAKKKKNTIA